MTEADNEHEINQEPSGESQPPQAVPTQAHEIETVQAEVLPANSAAGTAPVPSSKETFLKSYLKKAGKAMAIMAIIGCGLLMFAAWMIVSTLDRIVSSIPK